MNPIESIEAMSHTFPVVRRRSNFQLVRPVHRRDVRASDLPPLRVHRADVAPNLRQDAAHATVLCAGQTSGSWDIGEHLRELRALMHELGDEHPAAPTRRL